VRPKRDVSRPEGVGESKNGHEGAGWGRCVQKGDTSQPKGDGQSKNGMIWGQKGWRVQKRRRTGPMRPKMGRVVSRRAGGESGKGISGRRASFGKKMEGRWALGQQKGQKWQGMGTYRVNVAGAGWAAASAAFLALVFLQGG